MKPFIMNNAIVFATKGMALEYAQNMYEGCELKGSSIDVAECERDDSMIDIDGFGEVPAVEAVDGDYNTLAVLAWWEEGGDYSITLDGKVVDHADYWALAQRKMRELVERIRDEADDWFADPEVWCEIPDDRYSVRWDEV